MASHRVGASVRFSIAGDSESAPQHTSGNSLQPAATSATSSATTTATTTTTTTTTNGTRKHSPVLNAHGRARDLARAAQVAYADTRRGRQSAAAQASMDREAFGASRGAANIGVLTRRDPQRNDGNTGYGLEFWKTWRGDVAAQKVLAVPSMHGSSHSDGGGGGEDFWWKNYGLIAHKLAGRPSAQHQEPATAVADAAAGAHVDAHGDDVANPSLLLLSPSPTASSASSATSLVASGVQQIISSETPVEQQQQWTTGLPTSASVSTTNSNNDHSHNSDVNGNSDGNGMGESIMMLSLIHI